ncbi:bifunctional metallophosphatase/5'-nucleotidase [Bacillus sp. FJAT-45350]|uniref:bifunctional metallophosphatase/5'-nucleotidase n=1 Tax=Bacillus sp. FJAT-45350 TaxID=2011014 RepID=UPI000BB7A71E|nr:bifunctional UDP-sugar hydrolase/5'-nucleotidase [Bacillus sp. FJAT-45350]
MSLSTFHIYHTNDLHSHFEQWPYIASYLKEKRKELHDRSEDVLLFDIGDHADRCHPLTDASLGKANVTLLNEVGYDNVTIGNNEGITFAKEDLSDLYSDANFQVLVSNLYDEQGRTPRWTKEFDIHKLRNGVKVGVIGVTVPFYPFYTKLGWTIKDPLKVLPPLVEKVRREADFVVLLSHLGIYQDELIAEGIEGIDVILGGHLHHVLEEGRVVNNTLIGQAGKFGEYVGHLEITYDEKEKSIVEYGIGVIEMKDIEPSAETIELLAEVNQIKEKIMSETIVNLKAPLTLEWFDTSDAVELLAEGLKEWCQTDLSMVNAGVLLEELPVGPVTKGDVHRICPHPINPCVVTLSGKRLKETIHHAFTERMKKLELRGYGFRGKVLGQMVFSGIDVKVKKLKDGLDHVTEIKVLGEPLSLEKEYRFATLDMFTFGKLYPAIAAAEDKEFFMPEMLRDILTWKLKKL